jgi:uncharacterized protein (TIGR02300 family)
MPEIKLGTKYECYNCGTKFYDLGKPEALCPKCGADQRDAAVQSDLLAVSQSSRRRRKADVPKTLDVEEEEPIVAEDFGDEEMVAPDIVDEDLGDEEEEDFDDDEA